MLSDRTTPSKDSVVEIDSSQDLGSDPAGLVPNHPSFVRSMPSDTLPETNTPHVPQADLPWLDRLDRIRSDAAKDSAQYWSQCDAGQGGE